MDRFEGAMSRGHPDQRVRILVSEIIEELFQKFPRAIAAGGSGYDLSGGRILQVDLFAGSADPHLLPDDR